MKVAVLADIHANFVALQAIAAHIDAWQPDQVIVGGDIVNRGPRSLDCLRFVLEKQESNGWRVVGGNHEDYVLSHTRPDAPRSGPTFELHRHSYWTYRQLDGLVSTLAAMPFQQSLIAPNDSEVRITHASMRGNRDGIYPETSDDELRQKIQPSAPVMCVGHTHRPLIRRIDGKLVVNVGSAGLPFDGNRRPSYAQLTWQDRAWDIQIVRVDYDVEAAERDLFETGFFKGSGPIARIIHNELLTGRSRLFYFSRDYEEKILAGELTMAEAVDEFLAGV